LLFGGETTVTVRGPGKGGRNQELALAFACRIAGAPGIKLLSAATDGVDGPTDAAGAVVDGVTVARARLAGLEAEAYLERNDSYSFFKDLDSATGSGAQIVTGPTGVNVMDIQILCVEV
jgi:glycerate-2-kinase